MSTAPPQSERRSIAHPAATDGDGQRRLAAADLASTIGNAGVGRVLRSTVAGRSGGTRAGLDESVARAINRRRGGGAPLPGRVREQMEGAFGHDFSGVRLHTDAAAHRLSQSVDARAFTVGSDIFYSHRARQPTSLAGRRLLAHELTHTLQQSGADGRSPSALSSSTEPAERQADAVSQQVASHRRSPPRRAFVSPTLASPGTVMRRHGGSAPRPAPSQAGSGGLGIVDQDGHTGIDPGLNLREEPSEEAEVLRRLPHNTPLYVQEPDAGWSFVVARDDGSAGYVAVRYVNTALPDPGARLHRIQPGESALHLAQRFYDSSIYRWGQDARFYVNVLVLVNREADRIGIRKPSDGADWEEAETEAGRQIWIPSLEFAKGLRGRVRSGSISYGAWETVRDAAAAALRTIAATGAFVGGVVVGALKAVWDAIAGIAQLAWGIFKSLISGSIISDARELVEQLRELDPGELAEALADWLDSRWNHEDLVRRWYWRGWILGYVIAEVLMLIFSGGLVTTAKWAAKTSKIARLLERLAPVQRLTRRAEAARHTPEGAHLAAQMRAGTRPAQARRNVYPDFEALPPGLRQVAKQQTARLSQQLGIPVPADRVLSAPWIGRVRDPSGRARSVSTSQGWLRNEQRFWNKFRKEFPEDYALLDEGRTVSRQLARRYQWDDSLIGDRLVHHHMENSNLVVAVPRSLHQRLSRTIHARPTVVGSP